LHFAPLSDILLGMGRHGVKKSDPFARWLRAARASLDQTQAQAAARISVSRATVSAWENGISVPLKISELLALAAWYPVEIEQLIRFLRRYHG
jgi:transcriptional regulator with XRE-family HTH domain